MKSDDNKGVRLLALFTRLNKGEVIKKSQEMERYRISEETFRRYIHDIRKYLAETWPESPCSIACSRKTGEYYLKNEVPGWLNKKEIMGVAKVLLESRAFNKDEMSELLDKILKQCNPADCKNVVEMIRNERHHLVPLKHGKPLLDILWDLSEAIRERRVVSMQYKRVNDVESSERVVKPRGIVFSEFYFYLIADIHEENYTFPATFRLDRIESYIVLEEQFKVWEKYTERFEEGEFRKRIQFMQTGELLKIQFKFWRTSLEAILDRLPTARVIETEGDKVLVEAEVFGKGAKMWFLSQAEYLEVVSPASFRQEIQETIQAMSKNYQNKDVAGEI